MTLLLIRVPLLFASQTIYKQSQGKWVLQICCLMNSLRVKTYNLLPIEKNYCYETRAKVHFWCVSLEFWTPYYAFKMCPIFCSFPNFGLIRKIPLSLVAQLVSFAEKNVDPPSGLGKNYDKQLCTQILGVEFPFNPMS